MPAKRIIPCLDIKDGRVVKGTNFVGLRDAGDPVALAKIYNQQGADELVFLDITASQEKRKIVLQLVGAVAREVFIPFTVGGGVADLKTIEELLLAGAEKVSLNTAAIHTPELIPQAAERFGCQCVVVAIDAKRVGDHWEVFTHGGRNPTGLNAVEWAKQAAQRGAGEILLTSMDADGTRAGYDLALTKAIYSAVPIPVIASGGAGSAQQVVEVLAVADAALLASLLHYGELTVAQIKQAAWQAGFELRWPPQPSAAEAQEVC